MNSRVWIMFILALLLAAGAATLAYEWVRRTQADAEALKTETVPVVAAALPIPFAKRLEETDMKIADWPKGSVPAEHYSEIKPLVGKIVTRSLVPGELLSPQRVKEHLGGSTLSALIKEGMRAVTVRVDDVAGVAGFIMPENRVDMLATRDGATYTVLRNVNVLAIDQEASPEKDKPTVVRALTLEVTPAQAEVLVEAMRKGPLQFALRNPLDSLEAEAVPAKAPQPAIQVPPPEPRRVAPRKSGGVRVFDWDSKTPRVCENATC